MSDPAKPDHERPDEPHVVKSSADPGVAHKFLTAVLIAGVVGLVFGVLTGPINSEVWDDYFRGPVVGVLAVVVLRVMGQWPFKG